MRTTVSLTAAEWEKEIDNSMFAKDAKETARTREKKNEWHDDGREYQSPIH